MPQTTGTWAALNKKLPLTVVVVDRNGAPIPDRKLEISIYANERYWWWEYRSFDDYRRRFKSDVQTRLVERLQVVERLTDAGELDRAPGDRRRGKGCSSPGIAVELGQHDPGDADPPMELVRAAHGVLTGEGIESTLTMKNQYDIAGDDQRQFHQRIIRSR